MFLHATRARRWPGRRAKALSDRRLPEVPAVLRIDPGSLAPSALGRLVETAANPMEDPAWALAAARAFRSEGAPALLVAGSADAPRGLWPLTLVGEPVPRLRVPGASVLGEPIGVPAEAGALDALAAALARTGWPLHLERVFADSPVVGAIRRAYAGRGLVICRPAGACPWLPLHDGWLDPEAQLPARRRSDLRRARRRAEALGPVSFEWLAPRPEELDGSLALAWEVEARGWKGRAGTALREDPVLSAFFRAYAESASARGILRLALLRVGERVAAMQLAVEVGGRLWGLKTGYDEAFARCSPGTLLLVETLRQAAALRLASYEFLGSVEPWTPLWTTCERPCVALSAYPMSFCGLTALMADSCRFAGRRLRAALPATRAAPG